jgi:5-methylcytosine-specific restriction protein B
MAEGVRAALLLRECLQVMADADEPLHGKEVLARVDERVEFTPYEREPYNDSGQLRWDNHLRWYTGDAATAGLMIKRDGSWSLTEAGEAALQAHDADGLLAEVRRRCS